MKRIISWLADNADAAIGLTLAIIASVLGIINLVPDYVIANVTVLMLATLAFIALRDRHRSETAARQIRESVQTAFAQLTGALASSRAETTDLLRRTAKVLDPMPGSGQLTEWHDTVSRLGTALEHAALVQVVPGDEIQHVLMMARSKTDHWSYKGGTGTYLRAVTLPECVRAARHSLRPFEVKFEIIDPANRDLCARYAGFRASLEPAGDAIGERWTVDRVRKEAFATILAACWHRQRFTLLRVAGGLSPVMTTFRMDMSASHVIITQESRGGPALVVEAGKPHFIAYEKELHSSFDQAQPVPFELARDAHLGDEPTVEEARRLFSRLGLPLPSTFRDGDVSDIIAKAIRPKNPYA